MYREPEGSCSECGEGFEYAEDFENHYCTQNKIVLRIFEELQISPEFHRKGNKDLNMSIDEIEKIVNIVQEMG